MISSILVACNVMEAAGTGFDKIIEEYKETDGAHKPYIYASSDHFTYDISREEAGALMPLLLLFLY